MIAAIYQGLIYGLIAGCSAFGFMLTCGLIIGAIELINYAIRIYEGKPHVRGKGYEDY